MPEILSRIKCPNDLKALSRDELQQVANELRQSIIQHLSKTGGHFASNLGATDLIVALHAVYDVPHDKIIWDVGHQCYAHKMLTGRLKDFPTLRQYGGISGFLRRDENPYDLYGAGHASTSISAAYGFAVARDISGGNESVLAVIGDAGLTGGLALEGLNNAGHSGRNFTVVLNDNEMSIAANVGALSTYLAKLRMQEWFQSAERTTKSVLRSMPAGRTLSKTAGGVLKHSFTHLISPDRTGVIFEEMGFTYIGPIDGHNLDLLIDVFRHVKQLKGPVLVHIITVKGKGYHLAEGDARKFHAVAPFAPETGIAHKISTTPTYTSVFANTLIRMAEKDQRVVAITAAMPDGTGVNKFADRFPDRAFDVGIAEEHAVCFAAGLAASGQRPVVAIYSTFLQRAYDIIIHDVALQNLPVIFALDRGGLAGEDGATHHGAFDLSYLRCIPNMVVMAPKDGDELERMLAFSLEHTDSPLTSPIAIRYPRGAAQPLEWLQRPNGWEDRAEQIALGEGELLLDGTDAAIIAIGSMVRPAYEAAVRLANRGIRIAVMNARFVKPLDDRLILELARKTKRLLLVEENVQLGGFGSAVLELLAQNDLYNVAIRQMGLPDHFVEHGSQEVLKQIVGLTPECIAKYAIELIGDRAAVYQE